MGKFFADARFFVPLIDKEISLALTLLRLHQLCFGGRGRKKTKQSDAAMEDSPSLSVLAAVIQF